MRATSVLSIGSSFKRATISCNITKISISRSFATYKTSTGLAGLDVDPDALNTVHKLSTQILENVKKIPERSVYRQSVEKWFNFINKTVTATTDVRAAEDTIGLGQMEEVIEIANEELELIEEYYEEKGWELVEEAEKHADEMAYNMRSVIEFSTAPAAPTAPPK